MILRYWMKSDEKRLLKDMIEYEIPKAVVCLISNTLNILDQNYGADRKIEDDGGYIAVIINKNCVIIDEYQKLLDKHNLKREYAEFEDIICKDQKGREWKADLYIVSSDYGVTIIYINEEKEEY